MTSTYWTPERVRELRRLWAEGFSASYIAKQMKARSENAIYVKVAELKLEKRHPGRLHVEPSEHVLQLVRVALGSRNATQFHITEVMERTGLCYAEVKAAMDVIRRDQFSAAPESRAVLNNEHMGEAIARHTERARKMVEAGMTPSGACNQVYLDSNIRVTL